MCPLIKCVSLCPIAHIRIVGTITLTFTPNSAPYGTLVTTNQFIIPTYTSNAKNSFKGNMMLRYLFIHVNIYNKLVLHELRL